MKTQKSRDSRNTRGLSRDALKNLMTLNQSKARFAVVVVVEMLALFACLVPIFTRQEKWQEDCFFVGIITTIATLVASIIVVLVLFLHPKNTNSEILEARFRFSLECGIGVIYIINVLSLSSVIARTGGPAGSLYSPLIPIQLSGIIFLQIEKELYVNSGSFLTLVYTILACMGFLSVQVFPHCFYNVWGFSKDSQVLDYSFWNTLLTVVGMLLAFVTYWLPKQKWLIATFNKWYPA